MTGCGLAGLRACGLAGLRACGLAGLRACGLQGGMAGCLRGYRVCLRCGGPSCASPGSRVQGPGYRVAWRAVVYVSMWCSVSCTHRWDDSAHVHTLLTRAQPHPAPCTLHPAPCTLHPRWPPKGSQPLKARPRRPPPLSWLESSATVVPSQGLETRCHMEVFFARREAPACIGHASCDVRVRVRVRVRLR